MSTFEDMILNKRSSVSLGPFEAEAARVAHDLKNLAKESTPAGFRRPLSNDMEGIAEVLGDMGPMESEGSPGLMGRKEVADALPVSSRFRAEMDLPMEVMTDDGIATAQGEVVVIDMESGDVHRIPLDSSVSRISIPGLGEIQRSHTMTGGGRFLEVVDEKGQTKIMPIEEDELYSSFMEGGDADLSYAMSSPRRGYVGDVSYDTLHNIHSGSVGKKVRDDSARAAMLSTSDAERMAIDGMTEMPAGSMDSPYDTSMDFMDGMDDIEDADVDLIETLDEMSQLENFELAQVRDGLVMSRMMLEGYGHRPSHEYNIELVGRRFDAGLRQYVFQVTHPQMGVYEFGYSPDHPNVDDRLKIEKQA